MSGDDLARLFYLILLGCVVAGWFVAQNRISLGKLAQQALIWGLLFVGVIAGFGLWGDIRRDVMPQQSYVSGSKSVAIPRANNGHFYLTLMVDDTPVRFVVDTGASQVVLTQKDAKRLGLKPDTLAYLGRANTANGSVNTARVKLENIHLGPIIDETLIAFVNQAPMSDSLLGMTYLQKFEKIEISGNTLTLTR